MRRFLLDYEDIIAYQYASDLYYSIFNKILKFVLVEVKHKFNIFFEVNDLNSVRTKISSITRTMYTYEIIIIVSYAELIEKLYAPFDLEKIIKAH